MIDLTALPVHSFAVLGLGRSGRIAAGALLAAGKRVAAWDDGAAARAVAADDGIPVVDLLDRGLADVDALVLSPGIPHTHPAPHPVAAAARSAGLDPIGDVELLVRAEPAVRYVGITGTNGKSTTTALIGHILQRCGVAAQVGGNLGPPVLGFRPFARGDACVLELSSYQLELTPSLAAEVAVLLNITPDHLGRHGGFDGYVAAKRLIFARTPANVGATHVIGIDDGPCRDICERQRAAGTARVVPISVRERPQGGVFAEAGRLWDGMEGEPAPVLDLARAQALPGEHNAQNAAAAYTVGRALGLDRAAIAAAILDFPGLAHRQERIGTIAGVTYVNDSKATNPDAAARALASYRSIYWIAGGRPKEGGLAALDDYLDRIRHAFLIGEAAAPFAQALAGRVPLTIAGTLDEAVTAARRLAEADALPAATVLLSPACASFDQFESFEARGEAFRALVAAFATSRPQVRQRQETAG
ncbi:MAG: UDP-N-acetylmuramoyl-L-alanine--D-glutamate ligase [Rhodospirillales bacterium]